MKLSELLEKGIQCIHMKAKLKIDLELDDGTDLKMGDISEILIDKGDGTYHFECRNSACTVTADEIEILS